MAELIPLEHRIRIARAALIRRWAILVGMMAVVSTAWVIQAYIGRRRAAAEYAQVAGQYQQNMAYVKENDDLLARRDDLARRMMGIDEIQGDRLLLALLSTASSSMSRNDSMQYVQVEAHNIDKKPEENRYLFRIKGFTVNEATHSLLYNRLETAGNTAAFPVELQSRGRSNVKLLDGQVTTFEFSGNQPEPKSK